MNELLNASSGSGHSLYVPDWPLAGFSRSEMTTLPTMTLDASSLREAVASTEDGVLARLLAGDIAAVGELYDQHHETIRRFASRLLGDAAAAEDLVQDVFLMLPRVARGFRGDASFRTFLLGVAVQSARRHLRSATRRRALVERAEVESNHDALSRGPRDPSVEAERKRLARVLTLALDRLSLDHRVVFVLAEVEGRTSREISVIVGAPEGTVRTRLMHAKKNLREFLSAEGWS